MTNAHQEAFAGMRPVNLEAVERELDSMWREANTRVAAAAGPAISRNSVMTLVVITQSPREARQVLGNVHTLSTLHPSRAILVAADPQQPGSEFQAYIDTYMGASGGYGEDILIEAQQDAVRHVPGVVLPLIVSGLPAFLWWTGEPPWGSELLESLVDGSDRLIVDTAEMTHVEQSMRSLDDLTRRKGTRTAISDMNWT